MKYTRELFDESLITERWENVHGYVDQLESELEGLRELYDSESSGKEVQLLMRENELLSAALAAAKERERKAFEAGREKNWRDYEHDDFADYEKSKEGKT